MFASCEFLISFWGDLSLSRSEDYCWWMWSLSDGNPLNLQEELFFFFLCCCSGLSSHLSVCGLSPSVWVYLMSSFISAFFSFIFLHVSSPPLTLPLLFVICYGIIRICLLIPGGFSETYAALCDYNGIGCKEEVQWVRRFYCFFLLLVVNHWSNSLFYYFLSFFLFFRMSTPSTILRTTESSTCWISATWIAGDPVSEHPRP